MVDIIHRLKFNCKFMKRHYIAPEMGIEHVEIGHCQNVSVTGAANSAGTLSKQVVPNDDFWNVPSVN